MQTGLLKTLRQLRKDVDAQAEAAWARMLAKFRDGAAGRRVRHAIARLEADQECTHYEHERGQWEAGKPCLQCSLSQAAPARPGLLAECEEQCELYDNWMGESPRYGEKPPGRIQVSGVITAGRCLRVGPLSVHADLAGIHIYLMDGDGADVHLRPQSDGSVAVLAEGIVDQLPRIEPRGETSDLRPQTSGARPGRLEPEACSLKPLVSVGPSNEYARTLQPCEV